MIPGSWLEISNYSHAQAERIFSFGNIQKFLVREQKEIAPPQFPFLVLISELRMARESAWKNAPHFSGFVLRTAAVPNESPSQITEKIWIDFQVHDVRIAEKALNILKMWPFAGLFLTPSQKVSAKKISKLIKNLDLKLSYRPLDLMDESFQNWEELELFQEAELSQNEIQAPRLSIVIPHFESSFFLNNVLKHLENCVKDSPRFEVIVIDDGSNEKTFNDIRYFISRHLSVLPIKLARWNKSPTLKTGEKIFRAGASRNWGAHLAKAENLFFLDADMLVPENIIESVLKSLDSYDVVQFVRKHIPHHLSNEKISYSDAIKSTELYIEESNYWSQLFDSPNWMALPDYWKFTCTYALAIKRSDFIKVGRLRRNFIRYGFEDTDLGYRLFQANSRFLLNRLPLLHLTAKPDRTQNIWFKLNKINRISPMAKTFYRLNLNPEIYQKFQSLLD